MNGWIEVINSVGFPITVALFVLWRLNGKMDRLTGALTDLATLLHTLIAEERERMRRLDIIERQAKGDGQ